MVTCYVAQPIDGAFLDPRQEAALMAKVVANTRVTFFRPAKAYHNGLSEPGFVQRVNSTALANAECLVFLLGRSNGSSVEVERALKAGKPVALVSDTNPARSSVQAAEWMDNPLCDWLTWSEDWSQFFAYVYAVDGGALEPEPVEHLLVLELTEFSHGLLPPQIEGDAGYDLPVVGDHRIEPGDWYNLPHELAVKLPTGYYCRLVARSSASWKKQVLVMEGVLDEGYIGPLYTRVYNPGKVHVDVHDGERLSQLLLCPRFAPPLESVEELPTTARGQQGFGSTGGLQ